jgi:hypothetical protein
MDQSGPSEELLLISANLKEAIEGLSAWVQIHPLLHRLEGDSLTLAAKEIAFLSGVFQTAHLELISYSRQIPEPADLPIAADMQKLLEKCFLFDAAAETACEIAGHGFTSWGALILSQKKIEWTPVMIQQLFEQIPSSGWRKTRAILTETAAQLP